MALFLDALDRVGFSPTNYVWSPLERAQIVSGSNAGTFALGKVGWQSITGYGRAILELRQFCPLKRHSRLLHAK